MKIVDFSTITKKVNVNEFIKNDTERSLVIYSITSVKKNNLFMDNPNYDYYSTLEVTKKKVNIDNLFSSLDNYKKIISIGGGTATDIGKYLSFKFNIRLISIPTMLSTNAYATCKVALINNGRVESLDAVTPSEIYIDSKILVNSTENNLYGLVDIFSIYTALRDWDLAINNNGEDKNSEYDSAMDLLNSTIEYTFTKSCTEIVNDVDFIYKIIGTSGLITNRYGSGKPESGSEHIFAKALEKEVSIPHAVSVTNGIILMILSQNIINNSEELSDSDLKVISILKKLNMFDLNLKYNISFELISQVYLNLTPRIDRYSIVDLIYNNQDIKMQVLSKYKEIMKGFLK